MKRNQKSEFSLGTKLLAVVILIILSPIWLSVLAYMIGKMVMVYGPALRAVQTVPRYWLTWKHVKLVTGLSTKNTLNFLILFADNYFFECRLRDEAELKRIKGLTGRSRIPTSPQPFFSEEVIFYEFRMVWRGGRKRPTLKEVIKQLAGSLQPKPAFAPTYG